MAIKPLLSYDNAPITDINQWQKKREDIAARLYHTIGMPPVPRNTRAIETLAEEKLSQYTRRKIRYRVGEEDCVTAYLLVPNDRSPLTPAVVAMHQTVHSGKDEVVGLDGCLNFAYGHELATRGYVVLAPDYLAAGERIYPGEEAFESAPFY